MKKIICDICNKEIQDDKQWNKLITQKSIANNVSKIWDVCDNCCEKIWSFMVILSSKLINGDFLQVIREIKLIAYNGNLTDFEILKILEANTSKPAIALQNLEKYKKENSLVK